MDILQLDPNYQFHFDMQKKADSQVRTRKSAFIHFIILISPERTASERCVLLS